MGIMTCGAAPFLDRIMFVQGVLLAADGIRMTLAAKGKHASFCEALRFRGMGVMTAQTPLLAQQCPMDLILAECGVDHVVMATPAKVKPAFSDLERGS